MNTEQDDFANDKEIQRLRRIQKEHEEMISECVKIVTEEFSLEPGSGTETDSFLLFKAFDSPDTGDSFLSKDESFELEIYLVEYRWSLNAGKIHSSGREECFLGLLRLRKQYPVTCIFKETIREKITD